MKIKTSREIVFEHIRDYFPDDKRWETDKWVSYSELIQWLKSKKPYLDNIDYLIEELENKK